MTEHTRPTDHYDIVSDDFARVHLLCVAYWDGFRHLTAFAQGTIVGMAIIDGRIPADHAEASAMFNEAMELASAWGIDA